MANAVEIDGKNLLPIKEAVKLVSYSRDYITRLAREGKITAVQVGRQWYVDDTSLRHYADQSVVEAEARKMQLSEERKRERVVASQVEARQQSHDIRHRATHMRALVATCLILGVGTLFGYTTYWLMNYPATAQVAGGGFATERSAEVVYQPAPSAPAPNRITTPVVVTSPATTSQESFADPLQGVVLLPVGAATSAAALFSDDVHIVVDADGKRVEMVDEAGEVIGNPLPFVEVPVTHSTSTS